MINKFLDILSFIQKAIIIVIIIPIVIAFLIILLPAAYVLEWSMELNQKKFLIQLNHKNFFCYNNREESKEFIENNILLQLDHHIEIIYLDGRVPKSKFPDENISFLLYHLQNYSKFPHLIKARDGQVADKSINNEFYNTMNQNKPVENLLAEINAYFELPINKLN